MQKTPDEPIDEWEGIERYSQILPFPKSNDGKYRILPKSRDRSCIDKTNADKFPDGYIYLIRIIGQDLYKVGVSHNPKRRLQDIDSYLPYDFDILSLHYIVGVYELEADIKKELKEFHHKREWYNLSIQQARSLMIRLHNTSVAHERTERK